MLLLRQNFLYNPPPTLLFQTNLEQLSKGGLKLGSIERELKNSQSQQSHKLVGYEDVWLIRIRVISLNPRRYAVLTFRLLVRVLQCFALTASTVVFAGAGNLIFGQGSPLGDDEVEAAIRIGTQKQEQFSVTVMSGWGSILKEATKDVKTSDLQIWSPARWIAYSAGLAATEFMPFKRDSIDASMRRTWVVYSKPAEGEYFNSSDQGAVANIVLRTKDKKLMIQPRRTEKGGGVRIYTAGAPITHNLSGMVAYFDDEDIRRVAGPQLDQQFKISVAFGGQAPWNLDYPVKGGHLKDLHKALK